MNDKRIYVYRKQGESVTVCEDVIVKLFPNSKCEYTLYTDHGIDFVALSRLKRDIQKDDGGIVIASSAKIFGVSSSDVLLELKWFANSGAILILTDTKMSITTEANVNAIVLQTLIDVYESMPSTTVTAFRTGAGRKKIPYPNGWEELYDKWEDGLITATEFMEKAGLKRGTFYHLAAAYKEQQQLIIEKRRIG